MRLRYLHLPDYGVLKELRVTLERETILDRQGDLHFVVGLNGTGKSSLLRAIFETFRCLDGLAARTIDPRNPFPFPVSMVYDLPAPGRTAADRTYIYHHRGPYVTDSFFFASGDRLVEESHGDWDGWINWLWERRDPDSSLRPEGLLRGDRLQGNNLVLEGLPDPLVAYTSGSLTMWQRVRESELPPEDRDVIDREDVFDERPRGWDAYRELAAADADLTNEQREKLRELLDPNVQATQTRCLLLDALDLKLAAISAGIAVAAVELCEARTKDAIERWRAALLTL